MTDDIQLFPYQIEGAEWLASQKVALLADDMGLGKSAQAIHACDLVGAKRILVICPAIARINWLREFLKFSAYKRDFKIINKKTKEWPENQSIITSYESLIGVQNTGLFDVMIIDEAHYLKSKDTKRTKAVFSKSGLVRKAARTWALTGTPAPNHPGELWPLLFTFGATVLTYPEFVNTFCVSFQGHYGLQITGSKRAGVPELQKILTKIMLRRKKEEVMKDLPPIFYSDVYVEAGVVDISMEQSFFQYSINEDTRRDLAQKLARQQRRLEETIEDLGLKTKEFSQALESLAVSMSTLRRYSGLQKVAGVAELISAELFENAYNKIVIFAIHRDVIEGLRQRLKAYKPATLYGGYDANKKQRNIDRFQNNPRCRVMIANIGCAGTAVTLTAASQVAFIEQDWVPGNNAQAVMRCHRIGQTNTVFVRFFGIADSIDEKISNVLKRKTKELTAIFDPPALQNVEGHWYTNKQHVVETINEDETGDIFS